MKTIPENVEKKQEETEWAVSIPVRCFDMIKKGSAVLAEALKRMPHVPTLEECLAEKDPYKQDFSAFTRQVPRVATKVDDMFIIQLDTTVWGKTEVDVLTWTKLKTKGEKANTKTKSGKPRKDFKIEMPFWLWPNYVRALELMDALW